MPKSVKLAVLVAVALLGGAAPAMSSCANNHCNGVLVTALEVNASGVTYVGTDGDETALNCTAVSGVYLSLHYTDAQADQVYALLLSSRVQRAPVIIRIVTSSSDCQIHYVAWQD